MYPNSLHSSLSISPKSFSPSFLIKMERSLLDSGETMEMISTQKIEETVMGILREADMDHMTEFKLRVDASAILGFDLSGTNHKHLVRDILESFLLSIPADDIEASVPEETVAPANNKGTVSVSGGGGPASEQDELFLYKFSEAKDVTVERYKGKAFLSIGKKNLHQGNGKFRGMHFPISQWCMIKKSFTEIEEAIKHFQSINNNAGPLPCYMGESDKCIEAVELALKEESFQNGKRKGKMNADSEKSKQLKIWSETSSSVMAGPHEVLVISDDEVDDSPVSVADAMVKTENRSSGDAGKNLVEVACETFITSAPVNNQSIDSEVKTRVAKETQSVDAVYCKPVEPLNFDDFNSAKDMEVLGMERLKTELQSRGLKCGGVLQHRAARMFLLKSTPLDKLPKKLRAKK